MGKFDKDKKESDIDEKVLFINRCSKVVKGGRKFSFSALVLVGDRNKRIGVGFAKANEVSDAIRKAKEKAIKAMRAYHCENDTIPYDVSAKADGSFVILKAAKQGTGVIAGSVVRAVLEMLGIKDIVAKSLGSNNPNNLVRATLMALEKLQNRKYELERRMVMNG